MLTITDIPQRLQEIASPPKHLYIEGNLGDLLARPCVAVVGSRKVSPYGREVTHRFAYELARQGVVIVSGLAYGVDSVAHKAALEAGGLTIAVLGTPLDSISPAGHTQLAADIVKNGGALVSEYPSGAAVFATHFVARDRLIAGLSDATLITEAALKSGSLHTARFALNAGRDVMAVPGNITSPTSEGTNNLLKAGAAAVTSTADILHILGLELADPQGARSDNPKEQLLLDLLQAGTSDGTDLLARSKLPIAEFNQTLTMLEITGKIRSLGANNWASN